MLGIGYARCWPGLQAGGLSGTRANDHAAFRPKHGQGLKVTAGVTIKSGHALFRLVGRKDVGV